MWRAPGAGLTGKTKDQSPLSHPWPLGVRTADLTQDTELNPDSPRVVVAQAQPVLGSSTFSRSEDLTSQRSQRRLCYLLKLHP